MFAMRLSSIICLVILTTGIVCDEECTDQIKVGFSAMLCDEATQCANETAEEALDNLRDCFSKSGDVAKQIIESGNKLDLNGCLGEVGKGVCKIMKDLKEHPLNYQECVPAMQNMESIMNACIPTDGKSDGESAKYMAKMICVDLSKLKCETNDSIETINIIKNCLVENVSDFKDFKFGDDSEECRAQALEKLNKMTKSDEAIKFMSCVTPKKEFLENNDPAKKCTGLE